MEEEEAKLMRRVKGMGCKSRKSFDYGVGGGCDASYEVPTVKGLRVVAVSLTPPAQPQRFRSPWRLPRVEIHVSPG